MNVYVLGRYINDGIFMCILFSRTYGRSLVARSELMSASTCLTHEKLKIIILKLFSDGSGMY